eukprot:366493-Chlamydomonas_euryale.AAC.2
MGDCIPATQKKRASLPRPPNQTTWRQAFRPYQPPPPTTKQSCRQEFERRLGRPELSERVENLYFSFLLVLRATLRAAPLLSQLEYSTGDAAADTHTAALVKELVGVWGAFIPPCPSQLSPLLLSVNPRVRAVSRHLSLTFAQPSLTFPSPAPTLRLVLACFLASPTSCFFIYIIAEKNI